ncbi:MAG TPA: rod-binding protein [Candidatus Paceibacterota bacterium]|nr:rod-binding protein [Verrucomicrobiota bacterium]HRY48067.1 rod-binding protein [Candidatus Paceibacterota bacterium]
MDIPPLQRSLPTSHLPIEKLAGNPRLSEQEKVHEISRQFEAILLRQILRDAQKTVFSSDIQNDSVSGSIYQEMITQQLADSISQSGALGFADSLEKQLSRQKPSPKTGASPKPAIQPFSTPRQQH